MLPGAIYAKVPLMVAAFLLGLTAQNIKICVDTLVQAHVDDDLKGRVFVLYDMVFNIALVLAALIGAAVLPTDGKSVSILVVLAAGYLLIGGRRSRWPVAGSAMNQGTESLLADPGLRAQWSGRPPGQQLVAGPVGAERAVLDPALEQVVVRLADVGARRQAQDLHDLGAVQVGAQRGHLLLLGELGDPVLQIVVRRPQPGGLGLVPGRAVGPGQHVQPRQLVTGVAHVAAYGGVGPGASARSP